MHVLVTSILFLHCHPLVLAAAKNIKSPVCKIHKELSREKSHQNLFYSLNFVEVWAWKSIVRAMRRTGNPTRAVQQRMG